MHPHPQRVEVHLRTTFRSRNRRDFRREERGKVTDELDIVGQHQREVLANGEGFATRELDLFVEVSGGETT
jgi:hypothetical protein